MNITYRKATKEDFDKLYELAVLFTEFNAKSSGDTKRFFWDGWETDFADEINESLDDINSTYFVAENDDRELVGYILSRNCLGCAFYALEELYVKETARGNDVGSKLLDLAISEGKKITKQIRIEIFPWNENAKNFYLKHGFKVDAIVLEL